MTATDYRGYQRTIHEIDPTVDPAAVEALMRMGNRTLCHLPREAFVAATRHVRRCEDARPGYSAAVLKAYAS